MNKVYKIYEKHGLQAAIKQAEKDKRSFAYCTPCDSTMPIDRHENCLICGQTTIKP